MGTYLLLSTLTDDGRRTLKDRPERLQEVNHELDAFGARVLEQFALLGQHDFLSIVEAPDNETITRVSVELSSRGTIRLKTLAATRLEPRRPSPAAQLLSHLPGHTAHTFVAFTRLTPEGRKALARQPAEIERLEAEVHRLGATIRQQYRVLGEYDYVSIVEAADNIAAARISTAISSLGTTRVAVFPAISLTRFQELLSIRAYRTEPHAWQTQAWARALRRAGRHWVMLRHVARVCRPFTIEGTDTIDGFSGPCLVIANHSSHFDTPVVLASLPTRLREHTAVAAAADRFYRTDKRTWWYSLFWNTYPIARGGGSAALDYSLSLLDRGWSVLIYPEGGRAKPGEVKRFHHGPAILAMQARVPVLPVFIWGLSEVMPKGVRNPQPGPVGARIGAPVSLEGVDSVPDGTKRLEEAMRALAG
ncbi:MAG: GYD domain-containing protein [Dehalococcoidia bacterium]